MIELKTDNKCIVMFYIFSTHMLEKLTKEQEALIPIVRQEWLDRFFKYDKVTEESIYAFVDYLYNLA